MSEGQVRPIQEPRMANAKRAADTLRARMLRQLEHDKLMMGKMGAQKPIIQQPR
jgi:hypothetical protein